MILEVPEDGRNDRRMDALTHSRTNEDHFLSPFPPMLRDNQQSEVAFNREEYG